MQTSKKVVAGIATATLLAGAGIATPYIQMARANVQNDTAQGTVHDENGYEIVATFDQVDEGYAKESNVKGEFSFNQEGVTPSDKVFDIFGTTISSMCSKSASELADSQTNGEARYFINVGGDMKQSFTADVSKLTSQQEKKLLGCSCATGGGFGQLAVTGVPLSAVVEMADLEDGVNTVTAYGSDGFGTPLPLQYALGHKALIVYEVNGEELKTTSEDGSSLAMYIPETVARYFTRDIAKIELTHEDVEPSVMDVDPNLRNKIAIQNYSDGIKFNAGDEITFSGQADDLGSPIEAIEISFDSGNTWTVCETAGATADKWVNWSFTTSFENAGAHEMIARARTADGVVSPLEATLHFDVD